MSIEGNFGYNIAETVAGGAVNLYVIPKNNTKLYSMAVKTMYGYNAVLITVDGGMESKSMV